MLLARRPDLQEKIQLLGRSARFEESRPEETRDRGLDGSGPGAARRQALQRCAPRPKAPLLKVLLSNECPNHCHYCAFRVEAEVQRVSFTPDELAASFMELHDRGLASGLFLSSGLGQDALRTMDDMLKTAEILRHGRGFQGYLHLKILPGATEQYVEAACRLADRVSANLEVPSADRLSALCPDKDFQHDLVDPLRLVAKIRRREGEGVLPLGHITQFVVGAGGESDREILAATSSLYSEVGLTRAYFSAFAPLPGTPLEDHPATPLDRQRRLYQADTLLRQYGFGLDELPLEGAGDLPEGKDPKLEWALRHPERFPVELNRASWEQLLRVPGIGPRTAAALLKARRESRFRQVGELRRYPGILAKSAPFLLLNGRLVSSQRPRQLPLWPEEGAM